MAEFFSKLIARFKGFFIWAPARPVPAVPPLPVVVPPSTPIVIPPVEHPLPAGLDHFPFAVDYMLPNEGGFANVPQDAGGGTNFGITQAALAQYRGHAVTVEDVKNMSIEEAKAIYRANYWTSVGLDKIDSRAIATCIFDQGVLNGTRVSVSYAQLAANNCGASLIVDGILGPATVAAVKRIDTSKFLTAFHGLLIEHYYAIVAKNPSQQIFMRGWMNRADRLLTLT